MLKWLPAAALLLLASPTLAQQAPCAPVSASQPTHGDLDRSIGRLEGIIGQMLDSRKQRDEHVDGRLERIEAQIEAVVVRIESIVEMLASIKGGWNVLALIGGIAGMIGGWVVPAFIKRMMGW